MYYSKYVEPIVFALSIFIVILMGMFTTVIAQEEASDAEEAEVADDAEASEEESTANAPVRLESLVVVGTRSRPRSVLESAVPVDIVSKDDFARQGGADLTIS